jgi:hypothetical protein
MNFVRKGETRQQMGNHRRPQGVVPHQDVSQAKHPNGRNLVFSVRQIGSSGIVWVRLGQVTTYARGA